MMAEPLELDFWERDVHRVARDLLGCRVEREHPDGRTVGRIVEVEVYGGEPDPASHAFGGTPTSRTRHMFGPPGQAYVYLIYGIYHCLNFVCARGEGDEVAAILVRAVEPLRGLDLMADRRGVDPERSRWQRKLCSGPGKLCQALSIDRALDGHPLDEPPLVVTPGGSVPSSEVARGPRIGLNPKTCGDSALWPWRYWIDGSPWVSR